jgi:hypothetical protein
VIAQIPIEGQRKEITAGRSSVVCFDRRRLADRDELVGRANRERSQHQCVDEAEDRGVSANADHEREHRGYGEREISTQRAQDVPRVARDLLEPRGPSSVAHGLRDLRHATHLEHCVAASSIEGHASAQSFVDQKLYVGAQLLIEVSVGGLPPAR